MIISLKIFRNFIKTWEKWRHIGCECLLCLTDKRWAIMIHWESHPNNLFNMLLIFTFHKLIEFFQNSQNLFEILANNKEKIFIPIWKILRTNLFIQWFRDMIKLILFSEQRVVTENMIYSQIFHLDRNDLSSFNTFDVKLFYSFGLTIIF